MKPGRNNRSILLLSVWSALVVLIYPWGPAMASSGEPWYGTATAAALLYGSSLFLVFTAAVGWAFASLGRLFRRERSYDPETALAARQVAVLFGLLQVGLLLVLPEPMFDIDLAFGVPRFLSSRVEPSYFLRVIPALMAFSAGVMVILTFICWRFVFWTRGGRLHYTLLTLSTLGVTWLLFFYNLI